MISFGIVAFIAVVILVCYFVFSKNESVGVVSDGGAPVTNSSQKGGVNNPGFLITTNISWKGKTTPPGAKFECFDTMRNGIRAWGINLFQKYKSGVITNTNTMIDVLTPAGSDNPEIARNNYKASVAQAQNWQQLFYAVFEFEANPSWLALQSNDKSTVIMQGLSDAVNYVYNGQLPQYFQS